MASKKSKGSKAKTEEPVGIEAANYRRNKVDYHELEKVDSLSEQKSAKIVNIESLYPEWNVSSEEWTTPFESENIVYPQHLEITSQKHVKAFLALEPEAVEEDGKKGKKAEKKKPAKTAGAVLEFEEPDTDEHGTKLPKVFYDTVDGKLFKQYTLQRNFFRWWSEEQIERREFQEKLQDAAEDEAEKEEEALENVNNAKVEEEDEDTEPVNATYARDLYAEALKERDVNTETPNGVECDPVMCGVFRYISQFAPNVLQGGKVASTPTSPTASFISLSSDMPFLWRAIYPQLPNGRPMYNPAGRYCVKLYVGGKWRKITINDAIPVNADGTPLLCSSVERLELWPLLLSKALYALYTALDYHHSMPDMGFFPGSMSDGSITNDVRSKHAASFTNFAIHALTGWLPSTPFAVYDNFNTNLNKLQNLLMDVVEGGASNINESDIPGENPALAVDETADRPKNIPKTLKVLRREFEERIAVRNQLISNINDRESKIKAIQSITSIAYKETFCICYQDTNSNVQMRILPILAISLGGDSPENVVTDIQNCDNIETLIQNMKFLTSWSVGEVIYADPPGDASCKGIGGQMEIDLTKPIPGSSCIEQQWVPMSILLEQRACIMSLDTLVSSKNRALLGWHWMPPPEDPVAAAAALKNKKKDAPVKDLNIVTNPGEMPTMFLKLNTTSLYKAARTSTNGTALSGKSSSLNMEHHDETKLVGEGDSEAAAAIEMQQDALNEISEAASSRKSSFAASRRTSIKCDGDGKNTVKLSVFIHNDVLTSDTEGASAPPQGNILVLEEVLQAEDRKMGCTPLVISVELFADSLLPFTKVSVGIPVHKLQSLKEHVFWVRLLGDGSSLVQFAAGVPLEVGEADKIWKEIPGKHVLVRSGEIAHNIRCDTEKLLFRQFLQLQKKAESTFAVTYLHIGDKELAKCITCAVNHNNTQGDAGDCKSNAEYDSLNQLGGNYIELNATSALMLIGSIYHFGKHLPTFQWKLTVVSDAPLQNHKLMLDTTADMYVGGYRPNNRHLLFRDVLTVEKDSFPLSMRICVKPIENLSLLMQDAVSIEEAGHGAAPAGKNAGGSTATLASPKSSQPVHYLPVTIQPRPNSSHMFGRIAETSDELEASLMEPYFAMIPKPVSPAADPVNIVQDEQGDAEAPTTTEDNKSLIPVSSEPNPAEDAINIKDVNCYCNRNGLLSHVTFTLRTYRKSDRKLVDVFRSKNGFLTLYNIGYEGYLSDKESGASTVDIIMECTVDQATMSVPEKWGHKWPYQFINREQWSDAAGAKSGAGGAAGLSRPASAHSNVSTGSRLQGLSAPSCPLFMWQANVLGGNVIHNTHDIHDLERYFAMKTKWEEATPGRAERASAASNAYSEKKQIYLARENEIDFENAKSSEIMQITASGSCSSSANATPRSVTTRSARSVPDTSIGGVEKVAELVATALDQPANVVLSREKLIFSIPQYVEVVTNDSIEKQEGIDEVFIDENVIEKERNRRVSQSEAHEEEVRRLQKIVNDFTADIRKITENRLKVLVDTGVSSVEASKQRWLAREAYKKDAIKRNDALRYLLQRSSDALIAVNTEEEDPKGKGKKGKGKK